MEKNITSYFIRTFVALAMVSWGISLSAQAPNLDFTVRYSVAQSRYEVYARPTLTQPSFNWGPSQISIVTPAIVPDLPLNVTSVSGGAWLDNSLVFAPAAAPGSDFHGLGSLGAPTSFTANVEKLIFHFTLPGGGCTPGIRLYINGTDPTSAAAGMGGGDFTNTVFAIVPGVPGGYEAYLANYNNGGTNCNTPPTITSNGGGATASVSVPENSTAVTTVVAVDTDIPAQTLTYTITGGADAALFTINPTTGALSFITPPNFEVPTDAGLNNVYDVQVTATDDGPGNLTDVQDIAVTVTNLNEAPVITSNGGGATASVSVPENTTSVTTVTSTDEDTPAQTLTYTITGGADAALFTINATTGALAFISAPNFETPLDAGANNVYDVQVTVTDNGTPNLSDVQDIAVTVTNANDNPSITSNGGGPTATVSIPENTTPVTTVTATDPDVPAQTLTYTITGGADAALFTINPMTGALSFITPPNFEVPTDAGLNNIYDVQVTVSDGTLTDVQSIAVTVTDVNEAPIITSNGGGATASVNVPENTTAVTTVTSTDEDTPAQTLTYTITGGADAALFTINATTGALAFISAPNFETPLDAGANNVYDVQVTVTDNGTPNLSDVQDIAVTVTNANDNPSITSNGGGPTATVSIPENTTPVTTVTATDPDVPAQTLTYTITGGADAALFTINPMTGALSFITAPNFEVPTDAGLNNIYDVQVTVTDNGTGNLTDVQSIAVTVTDVNEAPVITSNGGGVTASVNVPENTTAVTTVTSTDEDTPAQTLTYTITGGADAALFTINATTGALAFISAPNFEIPLDAGANNVYDVQVTVTDNGTPNLSDVQDIAVTVTNANDNPSITSNGGGPTATVSIPENTTPVTTVTAIDPDVPAQTLTYTITGGADAALFTINPVTGALSFITAPNFEVPTDAGLNNIYDVQVTVTDNGGGNLTDVQSIAVTVTDVNEAPIITSNGGGATASVNVPENTTAVTTVTSTDEDTPAQTLTYTITGGADAALFTINATTGALSFISAPNFETPLDAGANNVYDVQVTVTDNGTPNLSDVQDIAVTVTNANDNPSITSNGGGPTATVSIPENTTPVTTVTATDPDVPAQTLTYTITGGADAALFTINPVTGALSFITAPNFEVPTDAGLNNIYDVQVTVTDNGTGNLTDVQSIAVTVTDVNEAPVITSNGGGATASVNVPENTTAVTTVTSTDEDTPAQTLTYTITGGADAALFTINATTGALAFISAPNFENPLDAGANNVYDVQVTVTDNGTPNLSDVQNIAVTVTNANDNPSITSNGGGPTATVSIPENTTPVTTVTATDPDVPAQTLTYTITGGADAALFTINPVTGALSFITAPNFEVPTDAGLNNIYDVQVTVTDNGTGNLTDVQSIAVTVTDVNEAPIITSNGGGATASVNVPENTTSVTTVTSTDEDTPAQTLTYTITGGADAALFSINATTGALAFISAPNFETPLDAGANNVYDVQVTVTDNGTPNLSDVQNIAVTVTNANDNPSITSNGGGPTATVSIPENTTPVTTVTATDPDVPAQTLIYTITGGADAALFTINPVTGALSFITAPNFEVPTDAGLNNIYDVQVTVTDNGTGNLTDVQSIAVTVTDVNEAPAITSNGGGATASVNVPENSTAVTTVTAIDPDAPAQTLTFTITGGADAAFFTINPTTGVLTFITAPDFETPLDAGANNVYDVQVTVTDGALTDVQAIAVTVTDVNEIGLLNAKAMLQGALIGTSNGLMRDDLRTGGYIPLTEPYTALANARFVHTGGGGGETTTAGVLAANPGTGNAIVDWVFVELRSAANSSVVIATRSALIQRDGDIVSPTNGTSLLSFPGFAGQQFYVAIKHRNHLSVMTASAVTLSTGGTVVDFTTASNAQVFNKPVGPSMVDYDGVEMVTVQGLRAMWAGNTTADVKVKYQGTSSDNTPVLTQVLGFPANVSSAYNYNNALGYFSGDVNMDGKVKYQGASNDPSYIFVNIVGLFTPNTAGLYNYDLMIEQLPD